LSKFLLVFVVPDEKTFKDFRSQTFVTTQGLVAKRIPTSLQNMKQLVMYCPKSGNDLKKVDLV
jgi:hypothetical protein